MLGYGVAVQNGAYPKPEPDIWANAFTSGATRPAPFGVHKVTWNTETRSFEKNWINREVDNTDVMVPVVSAASRMIYLASKKDGICEYVGVDWDSGDQGSLAFSRRQSEVECLRRHHGAARGRRLADRGRFHNQAGEHRRQELMSVVGVRRDKAALSSGCKSRPANSLRADAGVVVIVAEMCLGAFEA